MQNEQHHYSESNQIHTMILIYCITPLDQSQDFVYPQKVADRNPFKTVDVYTCISTSCSHYVHTCLHILTLCVHIYIYFMLCIYKYKPVLHVYITVYIPISTSVCTYMCGGVYAFTAVFIHIHVRMYMYACMDVHVYLSNLE